MESLDSQLLCVSESWTPQQRLHVGNVAWAFARGDGSTHPDRSFAWGDPLVGFANAWLDGDAADVSLHLASSATPSLRDRALLAGDTAEVFTDCR